MHPQLSNYKYARCAEIIKALDECHKQGLLFRVFGGCNNIKEDLNACLAHARAEKTNSLITESTKKRKQFEKRVKEIEEEEFGPGGKLRKVIEYEMKLREQQQGKDKS